jgi:hypothetical protein
VNHSEMAKHIIADSNCGLDWLQDRIEAALAAVERETLERAARIAYLAIGDGPQASVKAMEIEKAIRASIQEVQPAPHTPGEAATGTPGDARGIMERAGESPGNSSAMSPASKDPQVRWRYLESVGEFALFWVSPFHGHEEKIATFWWPPDGARAEVEPLFRRIAERACTAPAAKRPGFFDKARVCTEDLFEPAAQAQTDRKPHLIDADWRHHTECETPQAALEKMNEMENEILRLKQQAPTVTRGKPAPYKLDDDKEAPADTQSERPLFGKSLYGAAVALSGLWWFVYEGHERDGTQGKVPVAAFGKQADAVTFIKSAGTPGWPGATARPVRSKDG